MSMCGNWVRMPSERGQRELGTMRLLGMRKCLLGFREREDRGYEAFFFWKSLRLEKRGCETETGAWLVA